MINRPSLLDTPNLINSKEYSTGLDPVDNCYANDSTIRHDYDGSDTAEWNTGKQVQETLPAAEWDAWMHDLNAYGWQITEILNSIYDELYSVIHGQQTGMSHELLDKFVSGTWSLINKTINFDENTLQNVASLNTEQTLINKTISFDDNTLQNVASLNTQQTLTNKTISFDDNTLQNVASLNTEQTLINKTINMVDNTFTCPGSTPSDALINIDKIKHILLDATSSLSSYTIGNAPYAGYELRITVASGITKTVNFRSGGTSISKTLSPGVHHITWQDSSYGWTFYELSGEYINNTLFTYLI